MEAVAIARSFSPPRGPRPCACTEVAHTGAGRSRLRPWVMAQGPRCESERSTTAMYGNGKSDRLIVAEKRPNKEDGAPPSAEGVEPSGLTKGNTLQQTKSRTPSREGRDMANSKRARSEKSRIQPRAGAYVAPVGLQQALERIRQASVCASLPEVRAQCGSSARWDLRGGRPARGVPTATAERDLYNATA